MKKNKTIECIRVIACTAVVLIHVFKCAHDAFPEMPSHMLYICTVFVNNLRWSVPVFLMITGVLLLAPSKNVTFSRIGSYILRVFVVLAVFGTGYAVAERVFTNRSIDLSTLVHAFVDMLCGKTWDHLWYLYVLIGLYILLPMMRALTCSLENKHLQYVVVAMLLFTTLFPTVHSLGFEVGIHAEVCSIYMLYMLLGYVLWNKIVRIPVPLSIGGICVSTAVLVYMAYLSDIQGRSVDVIFTNHASIPVVIQSCCIFALLRNIEKKRGRGRKLLYPLQRIVLKVSAMSFSIYVIHMFFINLFYKVFDMNPARYGMLMVFAIVFCGTYIASLIAAEIVHRIPILKKYM